MPAKGDAARRRKGRVDPAARYHRPPSDAIGQATRSALRRPASGGTSQTALLARVVPLLRRKDPLAAVGGRRLRGILVDLPDVRWEVMYREDTSRRPLTRCPICSSPLAPIRNRTLDGDRVTLGYRCARCGYWTHLRRRVPIRYSFRLGAPRLEADAR